MMIFYTFVKKKYKDCGEFYLEKLVRDFKADTNFHSCWEVFQSTRDTGKIRKYLEENVCASSDVMKAFDIAEMKYREYKMQIKSKCKKLPENYIEKKFVKSVKENNGIALKFTSPSFAGVPDRLVLFPEGKMAFAEFKAYGKKTRALQNSRIEFLKSLGFKVFVIDSVIKIQEAINEILTV